MSRLFERKKIIPRYKTIAFVMVLVAVAIAARATYIATGQRDYWMKVASRFQKNGKEVPAIRGNIFSGDGRLLASSMPEYKLYIDFQAGGHEKDSLWQLKLDSICNGLHDIFPEKSAEEFRTDLETGRKKQSRYWPIWKKKVTYNVYCKVRELPIFNLPGNKGGFTIEPVASRQHPFGSLAARTVGDLYGGKDEARCGLELYYDSILRGKPGKINRRKVLNKYLSLTDEAPIDGADIITTIDVNIQDIAERSLRNMLMDPMVNGEVGVAIVMEAKTGDIKAMVNLIRVDDGSYHEVRNSAVSDRLEPGSVFKTASFLVALDDQVCDTNEVVQTGNGIFEMYGAKMKDHNANRGGYGTIRFPKALEVSSNIGVSRIINKYYGKHPEKFVDGIYRLGLNDDLELPIVGYRKPIIRYPIDKETGKRKDNWYGTTLPWMSIGYETQIAPINTVTFYNAIANNGKMMRPRLVKAIVKDGEVLESFEPEVMREQIARPEAIKTMQTILTHVVSQGLGSKAGSKSFKVAGKTGTAQRADGGGGKGYTKGVVRYLLSFAGFFPADAPKYSCIVCIQKTGTPASGGGMCGPVFKDIAEGIMAHKVSTDIKDAVDPSVSLIPTVKPGNILAADYVLNSLGFTTHGGWNGAYSFGSPVWGSATDSGSSVSLRKSAATPARTMPDVGGMGARDAVYCLEQRGLKVALKGRGKVSSQSISAGSAITRGDTVHLVLK